MPSEERVRDGADRTFPESGRHPGGAAVTVGGLPGRRDGRHRRASGDRRLVASVGRVGVGIGTHGRARRPGRTARLSITPAPPASSSWPPPPGWPTTSWPSSRTRWRRWSYAMTSGSCSTGRDGRRCCGAPTTSTSSPAGCGASGWPAPTGSGWRSSSAARRTSTRPSTTSRRCTASAARRRSCAIPSPARPLGVLGLATDTSVSAAFARPLIVRAAGDVERLLENQVFGRERELLEYYLRSRAGRPTAVSHRGPRRPHGDPERPHAAERVRRGRAAAARGRPPGAQRRGRHLRGAGALARALARRRAARARRGRGAGRARLAGARQPHARKRIPTRPSARRRTTGRRWSVAAPRCSASSGRRPRSPSSA